MVRYAAGSDCRRVEDGVRGERKESVSFTGSSSGVLVDAGAASRYVKFVVEASKVAPR